MQVSVYDITAAQFPRSLQALKSILLKSKSFADAKKVDMSVLLNSRLAPDQFPLAKQIQIACDNAKFICSRLSGATPPKHADDETTFDEFIQRIDNTIAFIKTIKAEQFSDYEAKEVRFAWNPNAYLSGKVYLTQYGIPNFYFHLTTAYAILRHNGVDLGKGDFLADVEWISN